MNNIKKLWDEYAKTKDRDILVKIGEIARAEQIRQSKVNYFKVEAGSKKRTVRDRGYSRTD